MLAHVIPEGDALALYPDQYDAVRRALPIALRAIRAELEGGAPDEYTRRSLLLLADRLEVAERNLSPAHVAIVRVT